MTRESELDAARESARSQIDDIQDSLEYSELLVTNWSKGFSVCGKHPPGELTRYMEKMSKSADGNLRELKSALDAFEGRYLEYEQEFRSKREVVERKAQDELEREAARERREARKRKEAQQGQARERCLRKRDGTILLY